MKVTQTLVRQKKWNLVFHERVRWWIFWSGDRFKKEINPVIRSDLKVIAKLLMLVSTLRVKAGMIRLRNSPARISCETVTVIWFRIRRWTKIFTNPIWGGAHSPQIGQFIVSEYLYLSDWVRSLRRFLEKNTCKGRFSHSLIVLMHRFWWNLPQPTGKFFPGNRLIRSQTKLFTQIRVKSGRLD